MVIIEDRGKQYKVNVGDVIKLPKLNGLKTKDKFSFSNIVLYKDAKGETTIGAPFVKDLVVEATVLSQIKDKKVIVFKKKRRHNYRRKIGHRQELTLLKIDNITNKSNINSKQIENTTESSSKKESKSKGENNGS